MRITGIIWASGRLPIAGYSRKIFKYKSAVMAHDALLEVHLHAEGLLDGLRVEDFALLRSEHVVVGHFHRERVLVSVVVQVDEPVIQQEARVAFLPVRVVHLLATFDVFEGLDDEALAVVGVAPAGLAGALVVQHVGVGDEAVRLHALNLDAEDAAGDHHANLRVLLQAELAIVWHLVADRVVVLLDVPYFLRYLVLKRAALQPSALLLRVEDGEVVEGLG